MSYLGDYFTKQAGFVIEGESFRDEERAKSYLIRKLWMTEIEAEHYLLHLKKEFSQRLRRAKESLEVV